MKNPEDIRNLNVEVIYPKGNRIENCAAILVDAISICEPVMTLEKAIYKATRGMPESEYTVYRPNEKPKTYEGTMTPIWVALYVFPEHVVRSAGGVPKTPYALVIYEVDLERMAKYNASVEEAAEAYMDEINEE